MVIFRKASFLSLLFILANCSSIQKETASSYGGQLEVEARISWGCIKDFTVTHEDTPVVADRAFSLLKSRILKVGHPMVDSVSGASHSSDALKKALVAAQEKDFWGRLRLAFTLDQFQEPPSFRERREAIFRIFKLKRSRNVDVLVIGGGAAGMAAALEAKEQNTNLSVMLVEKLDILGGNAKFTRNLFDIVQSQAQLKAGITDTADNLYSDMLIKTKAYKKPVDPNRLRVFADGSASLDKWLRSHDITLDYLYDTRGIMKSPEDYAGEEIMGGLENSLKDAGVEVLIGTPVKDIDFSQKIVKADSRNTYWTIHANAVIVTAGGFAANKKLVLEQDPSLEDWEDSNSLGNQGDLLLIASNQGLPLDDMNIITLFTYGLLTRELTGDWEEGTEYILVNDEGERFIDENSDGASIARAIMEQTDSYAHLFFDEQTFQTSPRLRSHILKDRGYILPDVNALGLPALDVTLKDFNKTAAFKGRRPLKEPFYALEVRPLIHMTRGGLCVDAQSRILDSTSNPISGFYAAGEVTDMPFAALLGSLVFGIDAGKNAVASLNK